MAHDQNELLILANRRREVMEQRASAAAIVAASDAELAELDIAGKVIARLTGAAWPPAGEEHAAPAPPPSIRRRERPAGAKMTMPDMILSVMVEGHRQGLRGIEPKDAGRRISEKFNIPDLRSESVSPIMWRMWKGGRLEKIGEGLYRLPGMNEATDLLSSQEQSAASDLQPTQAGEGRAGGGT